MKKIIIALSFIVTIIAITIASVFSFNTVEEVQLLNSNAPTDEQLNSSYFEFDGVGYEKYGTDFFTTSVQNPSEVEEAIFHQNFGDTKVFLQEFDMNNYTNLKSIIIGNFYINYFFNNITIDYIENLYCTTTFAPYSTMTNVNVKNLYYTCWSSEGMYNATLTEAASAIQTTKIENYYYVDEMNIYIQEE
ncbi:MAG: hypothetical protein R3Y60_05770, partial [bacterium]